LLLDITLETTKEEGTQDALKFLDHRDVQGLVLSDGGIEGVREPFFEVLLGGEDLRH
jgi:hypothetical protein